MGKLVAEAIYCGCRRSCLGSDIGALLAFEFVRACESTLTTRCIWKNSALLVGMPSRTSISANTVAIVLLTKSLSLSGACVACSHLEKCRVQRFSVVERRM